MFEGNSGKRGGRRRGLRYGIIFGVIPAVLAIGILCFQDRQYALISAAAAVLSCVPFFLAFERRNAHVKELVLLAVMTALSVAGRIAFAFVPGFKPVTAIVVITAMSFGGEAGFLTGALSAVLSNFYFGQGPWTPFQMFIWGLIGFFAGLLGQRLKRSRVLLFLYGILAGVLFSLWMDIWTVLWQDGFFNFRRYGAAVVSALPFMAVYAASNVIFLFLLAKPMGEKLERVRIKYGLMEPADKA